MYGCESWTIKKDECQRIYVFESCWRRLRVPWTARISNQSIPKEINHEYSLEGLMLKLKLLSFGHLMQRSNSLEKTPMLGRNEGRRRRGGEKAGWYHWLNGRKWANSRRWWRTQDRCAAVYGVTRSQLELCNWTTTMDFLELGSCKNLKLIIGSVLIKRSESILQSSFQFKWQVTKAEDIAKHTLNRKNSIN